MAGGLMLTDTLDLLSVIADLSSMRVRLPSPKLYCKEQSWNDGVNITPALYVIPSRLQRVAAAFLGTCTGTVL